MKIIYLDQNQWIKLAKDWYGVDSNPEIYNLILKIKEKVKSGEIRIVLSQINIDEARNRREDKSREELISFMLDISQGYTISPYADHIRKLELEACFGKRVGMNVRDIKKILFMKGLVGFFGKIASIKGDFSEEIKNKMLLELESPESMRKVLFAVGSRDPNPNNEFYTQLAERLEKIRKIERAGGNNDMVEMKILFRFVSVFIIPELAEFTLKYTPVPLSLSASVRILPRTKSRS